MILIWRGWGFVIIPLVLFAVVTLLVGLFHLLGLNTEYSPVFAGLACGLSGLAIWEWGKRLNVGEERTLTDNETGEEVIISTKNHHTFFFIPIQFFGPIVGVIGIIAIIGLLV